MRSAHNTKRIHRPDENSEHPYQFRDGYHGHQPTSRSSWDARVQDPEATRLVDTTDGSKRMRSSSRD